jgi:ribosomal-protein-alanine N-acetyltransferase
MTLIRPVRSSDISEIERIAAVPELSAWTYQAYADEVTRSDSIFLLVETPDQTISGFIVGRIVPGAEAEIYNIVVRQDARRQGFGSLLLSEFIKKCTDAWVSNIWLEVRYSNVNAISFYKEIGFKETFVRPAFYINPIEAARIMKLAISA